MNITIVKGHVTTWEIKETEKGFYATAKGSNIGKTYKTKEQARKAIRIAEDNYLITWGGYSAPKIRALLQPLPNLF